MQVLSRHRYRVAVRVRELVNGIDCKVWRWVRPSAGDAYEYATRREAERCAALCFDSCTDPADVAICEGENPPLPRW